MEDSTPSHLDPSALGTKDYWDAAYTRELQNNTSNPTDVGTVWFSDANAEDRVLAFLNTLDDEALLRKEDQGYDESLSGSDGSATTFLDIGTGNGHMLFALREDGWEGTMIGTDYSSEAISLAQRIEAAEREKGDAEWDEPVHFYQDDVFVEGEREWVPEGGFDVVLDKGTFDAISLSSFLSPSGSGRRIFEDYPARVTSFTKPGGRVIVTSCNWTEEELIGWFVTNTPGSELEVERRVKYPSFRFGGKEGTKVCTVCFRRKG